MTNLNNHPESVSVRVPATAANLGPGFDSIGMAVDLWSELTVTRGPFEVTIEGDGADVLPTDEGNLVVAGARAAYNARGAEFPNLKFHCVNEIPFARGLGSSSAAIVSGIVAGFALQGDGTDPHEALLLAAEIEGHPDNVAPAIFGGCQIGVKAGDDWITSTIPVPEDLHAVILIPDFVGETSEARGVLDSEVSRADAVFNIGRSALLANALATGQMDLLRYATEDRLHQPQRAAIYKGMNTIIRAALTGGAHGAFLSGAGPSIMAFATEREYTVAYEMTEAARLHGIDASTRVVRPTTRGAHVFDPASTAATGTGD
ncbi:MAG: homoserine kinase [Chloroflexi bacterium]|nr:homoserine kinase [Chloroflexota bacterium]